ncbi:MAG: hypothetical protein NTY65_11860 [Planctomycetota bacterium]|nr:hypothetical protein [Planctomycetota bacterium]
MLALAALVACAATVAFAWADRTHQLIVEESVARLPEPLRGLFADEAAMERLKKAAIEPDERKKRIEKDAAAMPADSREAMLKKADEEKKRHYFDIDAITAEPPPFAHFPHDRAAAEKEFGTKPFQEHGTAPWAAEAALERLADAMKSGRTDETFEAAGDLAHYVADLHMPLHVSKNFNGKLTGNDGVHQAVEIGLAVRNEPFYAAEVRKDRTEVAYVSKAPDALFEWVVQANARAAPLLEADTAARNQTRYNPPTAKTKEAEQETEDPANEKSRPYYAALKKELEARGSPDAAAMRDAAAHLAQLYYTAWVRAGKPASFSPAASSAPETMNMPTYVLLIPSAILFVLLFWPRKTRVRG